MIDILKLTNGQTIANEPLMIYSVSKATTKTGKPYLCAKLGNKTGTIEARMWTLPFNFQMPEIGDVFTVNATVTEFNKQLQLSISVLLQTDTFRLEDFAIEVDNRLTIDDLCAVKNLIYDALEERGAYKLKCTFNNILDAFSDIMLTHTAACYFHHSGVGGWLKHTLEVVCYANNIYGALPQYVKEHIRYDILLLGAFLHDIGKLKAYTFKNGVSVMSDSGKMLDHIIEGIKIIEDAKGIYPPSVNVETGYETDIQLLEHIIASHHMELEWGAAVNPVTLEAVIVCHADKLSSSIDEIYSALKERPDDEPWTHKIFTQHNRQFTDSYKELCSNE